MSGWRKCKLGEVVRTNQASVGCDYGFDKIRYLDTGSITRGKIEGFQNLLLSEAPSRAKRLVKKNDIIYSTVRPSQRHYGYVTNPPENLVVSTGFAVITCDEELINSKFLYHYLSSEQIVEELDIIADASTSTYPSLKPSDIEQLEVLLPSNIDEQKAIAAILSNMDYKIDLLHRQNATLEEMAETLFRQWFIVEAKEEWVEKTLDELVKVIDNRGKTPPYQDTSTPYPIIEVNALTGRNRLVDYSAIRKYVSEDTFNTWFRGHPKKFDSLISTVGSIGEISMFLIEQGSIAQNVVALRAKKISPIYLFEFLKHSKDEIKGLDIGSVQPSIKVPHLLSIKITIPPADKLKAFDIQVERYLEKMLMNYKQIRTLEKLRDTLLPKLMSGEVRVRP